MSINTTKQLHPEFDSGEDTPKSGEHTMTNREWLMSLSDEELADHIDCADYYDWTDCLKYSCRGCKLQWLKAEHKEVSE